MITAAALLPLLDKIDAANAPALPNPNLLRQQKWADMSALLAASGDLTFIVKMAGQLQASQGQTSPGQIGFGVAQAFLRTLDAAYLAPNGYASLDAFLTAQNAPARFQALVGPNMAAVAWLVRSNGSTWKGNKTPSQMLSPGNVFAPATVFANPSVGAGGAVTPGLTGSVIKAANSASVVQTITGTATGGQYTFLLGLNASAAVPYNATAAQVQAALQALPTVGTNNLLATGGPLGTAPVVCTFAGALAGLSEGTVFASNAAATGGSAVCADTSQGYAPSKGLQATATGAVNGTLTLSVTYSGQTAAGVAFAGHVGTLVCDNLALGATTAAGAWTPAAAGERVSAVTAIASSGSPSATAGALTVQSVLERVTS